MERNTKVLLLKEKVHYHSLTVPFAIFILVTFIVAVFDAWGVALAAGALLTAIWITIEKIVEWL